MTPTALDAAALARFPLPNLSDGGKDEHGRLLVVGGGAACPGAAVLTAEAGLRAGAGKLQAAATPDLAPHLGLRLLEARIVVTPADAEGELSASPSDDLLEAVRRVDALAIGPGMMEPVSSATLARAILAAAPDVRVVLDAAALTGMDLAGDESLLDGRTVITPHGGEMARLLDRSREEVEADPLGAAREAARRSGAVSLMKGATTYIAQPDGEAFVHEGGVAGLGVSGSGDVLAGIMAGLLARGCPPLAAALWAVHLHAQAGVALSKRIGPAGFMARELAAEIPQLMA